MPGQARPALYFSILAKSLLCWLWLFLPFKWQPEKTKGHSHFGFMHRTIVSNCDCECAKIAESPETRML